MKGRFITVEGAEGVGKSTNISFLKDWLEAQGISCITTREPGGTEVAEAIRSILVTPHEESMAGMTELLLMFAARVQHVERTIKPALAKGDWVICDRFTDSSYAYQGGGRKLDVGLISQIELTSLGGFGPDLTLLLDMSVSEGLARAAERGEADRFEREKRGFFVRVRKAFLARAAADPDRIKVIDAAGSLEQVQTRIGSCMEAYLAEGGSD